MFASVRADRVNGSREISHAACRARTTASRASSSDCSAAVRRNPATSRRGRTVLPRRAGTAARPSPRPRRNRNRNTVRCWPRPSRPGRRAAGAAVGEEVRRRRLETAQKRRGSLVDRRVEDSEPRRVRNIANVPRR